jgi:hypothetical protein
MKVFVSIVSVLMVLLARRLFFPRPCLGRERPDRCHWRLRRTALQGLLRRRDSLALQGSGPSAPVAPSWAVALVTGLVTLLSLWGVVTGNRPVAWAPW